MKNIEKFLKQINTKIITDNPEEVIGNVVDIDKFTIKDGIELEKIMIDLRSFAKQEIFSHPNIKCLKHFFKQYKDIIQSYMYIEKETLIMDIIFQNNEMYKLIITKLPSEIEVKDINDTLITIFKF